MNLTVTVDGNQVVPSLEIRALSYGIDVTNELKALGLRSPFADQAAILIGKLS